MPNNPKGNWKQSKEIEEFFIIFLIISRSITAALRGMSLNPQPHPNAQQPHQPQQAQQPPQPQNERWNDWEAYLTPARNNSGASGPEPRSAAVNTNRSSGIGPGSDSGM